MIRKKFIALRSGILFINGGEINISTHGPYTYGDEEFSSIEQFQKQINAGLIISVDHEDS